MRLRATVKVPTPPVRRPGNDKRTPQLKRANSNIVRFIPREAIFIRIGPIRRPTDSRFGGSAFWGGVASSTAPGDTRCFAAQLALGMCSFLVLRSGAYGV